VALPNLLAREPLVPEFLQGEATAVALAGALEDILAGRSADADAAFASIHDQLRNDCAARVADALLQLSGRPGD
jgi:lipid-A-disaccharide synthase